MLIFQSLAAPQALKFSCPPTPSMGVVTANIARGQNRPLHASLCVLATARLSNTE